MAGNAAVASGYFEVLMHRIRKGGGLWFLYRLLTWLGRNGGWILLLPLAAVLHLAGFRRVTMQTGRIGHLTCEPDCFLKLQAMGQLPRGRRWFVLAPPDRIANQHLLAYWKPHLRFITDPLSCWALKILTLRGPMVHRVDNYILSFDVGADYYRVNREWGRRPPLLELSTDDRRELPQLLARLGLPPDAWYVCFHNREGGFSPLDEVIQSHRNARISSYFEAMAYVVEQGGWCIRMGDPTMEKLPPMAQVVDYAHHPVRCDRADVLLCAGCRFFVGCSSGLWNLASIFGVRSALAHMIPTSTLGYAVGDLSIPKLLRRHGEPAPMSFPRVFQEGLANLRTAKAYEAAQVTAIENTADEIRDLVREMHRNVLPDTVPALEANQLQVQFRCLLSPKDYGYHAAGYIGQAFLAKHRPLIVLDQTPGGDEPQVLVFLHIAKTGGTTLGHILGRLYPAEQQLSAHVGPMNSALGVWSNAPFGDTWSSQSESRKDQIRHVAGHMLFGVHRVMDRRCQYVAMLRDPVDRVASSYFYIATQPGIPVHCDVTDGSGIAGYIRSRKGLDPHNYQTRILCGDERHNATWDRVGDVLAQPMPRSALEAALEHLDAHFLVVGPVEEFDEVLVLLKIRLRQPMHLFLYEKMNVNSDRPQLSNIDAETVTAIRQANQLDIELYESVKRRFHRDCRTYEPLMEIVVPEFKNILDLHRANQQRVDDAVALDISKRCAEIDRLCERHTDTAEAS